MARGRRGVKLSHFPPHSPTYSSINPWADQSLQIQRIDLLLREPLRPGSTRTLLLLRAWPGSGISLVCLSTTPCDDQAKNGTPKDSTKPLTSDHKQTQKKDPSKPSMERVILSVDRSSGYVMHEAGENDLCATSHRLDGARGTHTVLLFQPAR